MKFFLIALFLFASYGYGSNIVDILTVPEYRKTDDLANIVCAVGVIPHPYTATIGVAC